MIKRLIYITILILAMSFINGCEKIKSNSNKDCFVSYPSNYSFVSDPKGGNVQIETPIFTSNKDSVFKNKDNILEANLMFNNTEVPANILKIEFEEEPTKYENIGNVYSGILTFSIPSNLKGESLNTHLKLISNNEDVSLLVGDLSFNISNEKNETSDIEYALLNGIYGFDENSSPYLSGVLIDLSVTSKININEITLGMDSYGFNKDGVKVFSGDERTKIIEAHKTATLDKIINNIYNKNVNENSSYKINQISLEKGEYAIYLPVTLKNENAFNSFNIACNISYEQNNVNKNKIIYPLLTGKKVNFSQEDIDSVIKLSTSNEEQ